MLNAHALSPGRSKRMIVEGREIRIKIYRHAHETLWTLAMADAEGASAVWTDLFETEQAAMEKALQTIAENGLAPRAGPAVVIPFPTNRAKRTRP